MTVIGKGERNVEILKQNVNSPIPVEEQVAIIYAGTNGLLRNVPVTKVKEWQEDFLSLMRNKYAAVLDQIRGGQYSDEIIESLKTAINDTVAKYN
jgi:F-type H+-transporting ATPase subunit alpha